MRRLSLTTALLLLSAGSSFAQDAPVFKPLDPSMTMSQPAASGAQPIYEAPAQVPTETPQRLPVSRRDGEVIDSVGSGAIPALPLQVMTQNSISYLSGGIGDEEIEQLRAQEEGYNLRLLITEQSGEFVSGTVMTLKTLSGEVLLMVNEAGPWVYARVPAGKYIVDITTVRGANKTMPLTVPSKGAIKMQVRV
ncbi:MAG: hypothetical protein SFX19_08975 [Alphaproteobacteria bacterium]|nr:hypothetical protein [Alphaproteobacteria bacterium]